MGREGVETPTAPRRWGSPHVGGDHVNPPPPGSTKPWAGGYAQAARQWLAARTHWPTPCARCGRPVFPNRWHLGHRLDRQAHPGMTWEPSNWQVEHPRCSMSAGAKQGNHRRRKQPRAAQWTAPGW